MKYEKQLKQKDVDWIWQKHKDHEQLTLKYIPTGKIVTGRIPYTRGEIYSKTQQRKSDLYQDLFEELENLVYKS